MRTRLTRFGSSWGLMLPRELLELLGVEGGAELDVEVMANMLVVTPPDLSRDEIEGGLAYLASKREHAAVYRRLAE